MADDAKVIEAIAALERLSLYDDHWGYNLMDKQDILMLLRDSLSDEIKEKHRE